jgi:hypothetical protein
VNVRFEFRHWWNEQLAVLAATLLLSAVLLAYWWPPESIRDLTFANPWVVKILATTFPPIEYLVLARRWSQQQDAPPTRLGAFTWWAGIASVAVLLTSFCLGWSALFLAPASIVSGLIVLVRELRARGGHELRNLIGTGCGIAAIIFLAA